MRVQNVALIDLSRCHQDVMGTGPEKRIRIVLHVANPAIECLLDGMKGL